MFGCELGPVAFAECFAANDQWGYVLQDQATKDDGWDSVPDEPTQEGNKLSCLGDQAKGNQHSCSPACANGVGDNRTPKGEDAPITARG